MRADSPFVLVAAFIVGTVAVARCARLIVDDEFPPIVWVREKYARKAGHAWGLLVECPFCITIWLSAADTAWAYVSCLHWTWWAFNLFLASAYVAAMICVRDIPSDSR